MPSQLAMSLFNKRYIKISSSFAVTIVCGVADKWMNRRTGACWDGLVFHLYLFVLLSLSNSAVVWRWMQRERSKQVRYRLGSRTTYRIRPKSNRSRNPVQCYLHCTCICTRFNRPCSRRTHDTYFKIQVYEFSGSSSGFPSGSRQCQYRISRSNSWLNTNQRAPSRCTEHSKKLRYSLCSPRNVVLKELELVGLLKQDIYMSCGA
jgi:hypothetical protein